MSTEIQSPIVLAVDDDIYNAKRIWRLFGRYHTLMAEDINKANQYRQEYKDRIALMMVDYQLQYGTGLDLLRKMREERDMTLFVLMTGSVSEQISEMDAKQAGADGFFYKPSDDIELIDMITPLTHDPKLLNLIEEIREKLTPKNF